MSKRKSKPNWLWLHDDVLELILKKLSYPDLVRFSAVCRSWQRSAKSYNAVSRPILLLTTSTSVPKRFVYSCRLITIYSLGEDKAIHSLFSSEPKQSKRYLDLYCIGYSNSMLVFAGRDSSLKLVVVNPFSGRRFRVPRINVQDFPVSPDGLFFFSNEKRLDIRKALILSRSTKSPPVLVIMYGFLHQMDPNRMAYCELGPGGTWAHLSSKPNLKTSLEDMVSRKGRLYVLSSCNSVEVWDFDDNLRGPVMVTSFVPSPDQNFPRIDEEFSSTFCMAYLVESMGEILLVRRWNGRSRPYAGRVKFDVYRMKMEEQIWEKLESLGDHRALFLGLSESVSVSSKSFAECRGNSIYFFTTSAWFPYVRGDFGVYSLEDKSIKYFYKSDEQNFCSTPIWLIPNPL